MARDDARRLLKAAAATVFHYSGLRSAVRTWRRMRSGGRRILIVGYHRVVEDFTQEVQRSIPGTLISKKTFRRHLEEAHAAGFRFATLGEALDVLGGRRVAPRDLIVITFDDGYRDVYRHAFPILQWMGVPSVMYLPSDYVGTDRRFAHDRLFHLVRRLREERSLVGAGDLTHLLSNRVSPSQALDHFIGEHSAETLEQTIAHLEAVLGGGSAVRPEPGDVVNWDEVQRMARGGMDLGAHTRNHRVLTLEAPETVEEELRVSKATIESQSGYPVRDFAYCNGWYSDEVIAALRRCGYRSAVTTEDLPNRIGGDPFVLRRKVLWENFSRGPQGAYSSPLMRCQLDDVFCALGMSHPVPGRRLQRASAHGAASLMAPGTGGA